MKARLPRLFTFVMILALVVPMMLAPTAAAPTPSARMGQVTTASDAAAGKIHSGLQAAVAAAAPSDTIRVMVHALKGADLGRYMSDVLVRPYVLPNGTQAHFGEVKAGQVAKLASLPQVAYLQEMKNLADLPKLPESDPLASSRGAGAPVNAADWFDVQDVHKAKAAWDIGFTGEGVKVMVNDSGIDFAHPDLQGTQARITDPTSPYYGWPVAFDSASMLALAYDYYLGTDYIATGRGAAASSSASPDYASTAAKRSGADLTTNPDGSLGAAFKPLAATAAHTYVFSPTSKSGVYHFGSHPDLALMKLGPKLKERWAVLVTDENTAGVYDTVYVDLNGDFNFRDEKPARKGSEEIYRDLNGDGYPDRSGGSIYWISDGLNPLPASDWLWGIGADVAGPGDLVAFTVMDYSESGGDHGQYCSSNVVAQGVIDGNAPAWKPAGDGTPGTGMVQGTAKSAKLVAAGNFYVSVDESEGYLFAALGYDGIPGTDDDIQIINNSWGQSATDNDGWDYGSRAVEALLRYVNPTLSDMNSSGNGAAGYGTVTSPGAMSSVSVGASTSYGSTGAFDSITGMDQFLYNDSMSWSGRGPTAMGENGVNVLAEGAWGAGDLPVNEAGNSWVAWANWGGTSKSSPTASGVMALVYQAFKTKNGRWPSNVEARAILMAGSDKAYNDGFVEGAGTINALRSVNIAAGTTVGLANGVTTTGGVYASPDSYTFGSYRGTEYEAFANIMHPGQTANSEFTVYNTSSADVTLQVKDEWLVKTGAKEWEFTTLDRTQESAYSGNKPDYMWDVTKDIPAGTDLMEVKVAFPFGEFDPNGNYVQDSTWRVAVYDWADVNGDGILWTDKDGNSAVTCPVKSGQPDFANAACELQKGEYNRFTYGYDAGTSQQARVKQPLLRKHDGVFVGLLHRDRSALVPVTHLKIQVNFYKMADFPWLTTDASVTVPAGGSAPLKAAMAVPALAGVGLYNGVIRLNGAPSGEVSIPVVANVAAFATDFVFGGPSASQAPYNNGEVYGYSDWTWRNEAGDWRFFFVDVPDTVKPGTSFLVDTRWAGPNSDIDTIVMGPMEDCFSNGVGCTFPFSAFPGHEAVYGPYTLEPVGGSNRNYLGSGKWRWDTSTGGPREIVAAPAKAGLNLIALQNVLFDGSKPQEPFMGQVGSITANPGVVDLFVGSAILGSFPVQVASSLALVGLQVDAFGLGVPTTQTFPQHQDNPDDPSTSFYTFPIVVQHGARLDVETTAPAGDLDLYLLYDFNSDGVFDYNSERVGSSTTSTANEFVSIVMPADGNYLAAVQGWAAAPGNFDITINNIQGADLTVSGLPTGPYQPNQPINFTVNWAKTIPVGQAAEGLILAGPPGAPAALSIPVRLHNILASSETKTFAAVEDAYIAAGQPTTTFNAAVLGAGGNDVLRSLARFDLSSISPANPVTAAKLRLYVDSFGSTGTMHDLNVYGVSKHWMESSVTWNAPWTTPGGDYVASAAGTGAVSSADVGKWVEVDVTSLVAGWVATPATNHGLLFRAVNGVNYALFMFRSRQYWLPGFAPQLVVTYGMP